MKVVISFVTDAYSKRARFSASSSRICLCSYCFFNSHFSSFSSGRTTRMNVAFSFSTPTRNASARSLRRITPFSPLASRSTIMHGA